MSELKPCPFCGSTNITVNMAEKGVYASCKDCFSIGSYIEFESSKEVEKAKKLAIEAWNTRYEPTCHNTNYKYARSFCCSLCGEDFEVPMNDEYPFNYCPGCGARVVEVD